MIKFSKLEIVLGILNALFIVLMIACIKEFYFVLFLFGCSYVTLIVEAVYLKYREEDYD